MLAHLNLISSTPSSSIGNTLTYKRISRLHYDYNSSFSLSISNFTTSFNDSVMAEFKGLIESSFEDFQKTVEGKEFSQESRALF